MRLPSARRRLVERHAFPNQDNSLPVDPNRNAMRLICVTASKRSWLSEFHNIACNFSILCEGHTRVSCNSTVHATLHASSAPEHGGYAGAFVRVMQAGAPCCDQPR